MGQMVRGHELDGIFCGQHALLDNRGCAPYREHKSQEFIAGIKDRHAADSGGEVTNYPKDKGGVIQERAYLDKYCTCPFCGLFGQRLDWKQAVLGG
jgi:hypothetical protein